MNSSILPLFPNSDPDRSSIGNRLSLFPRQLRQHSFKLATIGDATIGKSSVMLRKIHNRFCEGTEATIGAAFFTMKRDFPAIGRSIRLECWDLSGSERYRSITAMYFRNVNVILLMYDVSNPVTLENLEKHWIPYLEKYENTFGSYIVKVVVATKVDLLTDDFRMVAQGANLAAKHDLVFAKTSAKEGTGINGLFDDIFDKLCEQLEAPDYIPPLPRDDIVKVGPIKEKEKCNACMY